MYVGTDEYSMHMSKYYPKYADLQYTATILFFIRFILSKAELVFFFVQTRPKFQFKKHSVEIIF